MPLIIDGNNLLGQNDWAESDLISMLTRLSRTKRLRIMLCFDGGRDDQPPVQQIGRLRIRYSGRFQNADDIILAEAAKLRDTKGWILHTNDRELAQRARGFGMQSASVNVLIEQLQTEQRVQTTRKQSTKPIFEPDKEGLLQAMLRGKTGK